MFSKQLIDLNLMGLGGGNVYFQFFKKLVKHFQPAIFISGPAFHSAWRAFFSSARKKTVLTVGMKTGFFIYIYKNVLFVPLCSPRTAREGTVPLFLSLLKGKMNVMLGKGAD